MRILHVITTGNPASGGPIEAVRLLSQGLLKAGHTVEIVTLDAPGSAWPRLAGLQVWSLGPASGSYAHAPGLMIWLRKNRERFDVVVSHGLWQYHSLAVRQALRGGPVPYVVFPHGMLDPWFKQHYPLKHLKKWFYWQLVQHAVLRDAQAVLFTAEEERTLARESFSPYQVRERVVTLGVEEPTGQPEHYRRCFYDRFPELMGKRLWLFLGRLHEKKGPDLLLRAFGRFCSAQPAGQGNRWHLVMAGPPDSPAYGAELQQLAVERCPPGSVTWTGMLQGDLKWGAFHAAEAFLLPSHQENFGMAVAEALACSLPVLISRRVNIWREVVLDEAGFAATDNLDGTGTLLESWAKLTSVEQEAMRGRARRCYQKRFSVEEAVKTFLEIGLSPAAPALSGGAA